MPRRRRYENSIHLSLRSFWHWLLVVQTYRNVCCLLPSLFYYTLHFIMRNSITINFAIIIYELLVERDCNNILYYPLRVLLKILLLLFRLLPFTSSFVDGHCVAPPGWSPSKSYVQCMKVA